MKKLDSKILKLIEIKPLAENPRVMTDEEFNALAENIDRVGFNQPLVVWWNDTDKIYELVKGHRRYDVLKYKNEETVECKIADYPNREEMLMDAMADNINIGHFDPIRMTELFAYLRGKGYDDTAIREKMAITSNDQLKRLIKSFENELPEDMAEKLKAVRDEIKTIDDLSNVLNKIFSEHGDTLTLRGYKTKFMTEKQEPTNVKDTIVVNKLDKAIKYRKWGGMINYLCKTVDGFQKFAYDELVKNKVPAQIFIQDLQSKFPNIDKEHIPSLSAVNLYKLKLKNNSNGEYSKSTALALKDQTVVGEIIKGFSFLEERKKLIEKAEYAVGVLEKGVKDLVVLQEKTMMLPESLFSAVRAYYDGLSELSQHITEFDKLWVRFGFMPAQVDNMNPMIFAPTINQNKTLTVGGMRQNDEDIDIDKLKIRIQQLVGITTRKESVDEMFSNYPEPKIVRFKDSDGDKEKD